MVHDKADATKARKKLPHTENEIKDEAADATERATKYIDEIVRPLPFSFFRVY